MENEYVPGLVGLPETIPVLRSSCKPGGKLPEANVNDNGGTPPPPERYTELEYGCPTLPFKRDCCNWMPGLITIVKVCDIDCCVGELSARRTPN
jgi:hypothetical protein